MGACRGCGATLSPAQSYCPACGTTARAHVEITLEPTSSDANRVGPAPRSTARPGATAPPPSTPLGATPPTTTPPAVASSSVTSGRRPPGWPVVTGVLLVVAVAAIGLALLAGGSRDDPSRSTPTSDPPGAPPPTSLGRDASDAPTTGSTAPGSSGAGDAASESTAPTSVAGGRPSPSTVAQANTAPAVPATSPLGGPLGPVALRASLSAYHLVDIGAPEPVEIDHGRVAALDEESGWIWFSTCRTPPCPSIPVVVGFGPGAMQGRSIALPAPTKRIVATAGRLYVEAAGAIVAIDPTDGARTIVATGALLDARGSTVVVRSCDPDLACPVVVLDVDGVEPRRTVEAEGDDIRLSPDGEKIVAGSTAPSLARALRIIDVRSGERVDVGSDALRFVSVPFRWTPDGKWLVGATGARALVIVRVADGVVHRVQFPGLDNAIAGLFVRPQDVRAPAR